jgi:hypothetical protein
VSVPLRILSQDVFRFQDETAERDLQFKAGLMLQVAGRHEERRTGTVGLEPHLGFSAIPIEVRGVDIDVATVLELP